MSKYFRYFPPIAHDLSNIGQRVTLTNILRRFKVDSSLKNRVGVYEDYQIQAGDRPDSIAHKYYGSSGYSWLVMMFNERHDVHFDWPLFNYDFDQYIIGKYGSRTAAQNEVHEYRRTITYQQTLTDGTVIPERYVVIDSTEAGTLASATAEAGISSSGAVNSTVMKNKGRYTTTTATPSVAFSAPVVRTATATATVASGAVTSITVADTGEGYTSTPTVTISGNATATAVMDSSGTKVASINITSAGSGYTANPTVTIAAPVQGTTATGTVTLQTVYNEWGEEWYKEVLRVNITNAGTGYTYAPTITIAGGTTKTSAFAITKYDWESEENEKKRKIKLLNKRYLPLVTEEVKNILRNGI